MAISLKNHEDRIAELEKNKAGVNFQDRGNQLVITFVGSTLQIIAGIAWNGNTAFAKSFQNKVSSVVAIQRGRSGNSEVNIMAKATSLTNLWVYAEHGENAEGVGFIAIGY